MEINKYRNFIIPLDDSARSDLELKILHSLEENDKRVLNVTKFIVVTIFIFYLFKYSLINEVSQFGLSIKSKEFVLSVIPSMLCLLGLIYLNIIFRKQELKYLYNELLVERYAFEHNKINEIGWLTKLIIPIEFNQLINIFSGKYSKFFNIPINIAFAALYLLPFWVILDGCKFIWKEVNLELLINKFLLIFPIVLLIYSIIFFCKIIFEGINDQLGNFKR